MRKPKAATEIGDGKMPGGPTRRFFHLRGRQRWHQSQFCTVAFDGATWAPAREAEFPTAAANSASRSVGIRSSIIGLETLAQTASMTGREVSID